MLTHALEAYVSVMASDYTDGLAMKAIQLVFKYLPRAYKNGAEDADGKRKGCTMQVVWQVWHLQTHSWD